MIEKPELGHFIEDIKWVKFSSSGLRVPSNLASAAWSHVTGC